MSNSLSDCCSPCSTVPPVNVPGSQGNPGSPGTPGADGGDAFAIVQAPGFTIPTVGNDVLAPVSSTAWMTVGETVIAGTGFGGPVTGPANFTVITINSATTVTLRALAYPGDAVNPASIAASALLAPSGLRGPTGAAGSVFPTTTAGDLIYNTDGVAGNAARLGIGAQGQSLFADPSTGVPASIIAWKGGVQTLTTNFFVASTGANTAETALLAYTVAANQLRNVGDSLEYEAVFSVESTANNATKLIKVYLGGLAGAVVAQYGIAAPAVQDGGKLIIQGRVCRVGPLAQYAWARISTTNAAGASTTFFTQLTGAQDLTTPLSFVCSGTNGSAFAGGISQTLLLINYRAGT